MVMYLASSCLAFVLHMYGPVTQRNEPKKRDEHGRAVVNNKVVQLKLGHCKEGQLTTKQEKITKFHSRIT